MNSIKRFCSVIISLVLIFQAFALFCYAADENVYYNNKNSNMKIALTFDDGPHPRYTPQILKILDKYNVKATFFVIGENAHFYPNSLCEIAEHGHELANHTYSHIALSNNNLYKLKDEMAECENEIFNLTEERTKLFRPPEGLMSSKISEIAKELDYNVILWDIDTRDWAHTPPSVIADNVVKNTKSGDVILMHDFIGHNSPTPEALEIFIPQLLKKGFKFVTVSELIAERSPVD